jgi:hypothetical protein
VSEKAKLIRGDPPKIALRRRGSPLKIKTVHNEKERLQCEQRLTFLYLKKSL